MKNRHLIIGSRASKLALIQAEFVKSELQKAYPELDVEIKTIKTTGDKILDVPLSKIGDKGLFTKEIEEALLRKEVDLAVHSMKDLPTEIPGGLKVAAVTQREDPRDVLVCRYPNILKGTGILTGTSAHKQGFNLETLPKDCKVGTSSLRRRAQLLNMRSDLRITDLRGNLDTRIRKLEDGAYDAIVVARAGMKRLGLIGTPELNISAIPIDNILPSPGQGALGIEIRGDDPEVSNIVKVLDDFDSHLCVEAERVLLSGLGGGCQVPIGVYAKTESDQIVIKAGVFSLDGKIAIKDEIFGDKQDAPALSKELVDKLLKQGAKQILDEVLRIMGNK